MSWPPFLCKLNLCLFFCSLKQVQTISKTKLNHINIKATRGYNGYWNWQIYSFFLLWWSKPDFLLKIFAKIWFQTLHSMLQYTWDKFKALNIKDFELIKKNLFSCFFKMSAFGVELTTVSFTVSLWKHVTAYLSGLILDKFAWLHYIFNVMKLLQ